MMNLHIEQMWLRNNMMNLHIEDLRNGIIDDQKLPESTPVEVPSVSKDRLLATRPYVVAKIHNA